MRMPLAQKHALLPKGIALGCVLVVGILIVKTLPGTLSSTNPPHPSPTSRSTTPSPLPESQTKSDASYYDEIVDLPQHDLANAAALTTLMKRTSYLENPVANLYEKFRSGYFIRIILPLSPVPSSSRIHTGEVKGYRVQTKDYDLRIYHLLNLSSAQDFCTAFLKRPPASSEESKNPLPLKVREGKAMQWDTKITGQEYTGILACNMDTDQGVWGVEMYIQKDKYTTTYQSKILRILDSFAFEK